MNERLDPRLLSMKPSPGHQDNSPRQTENIRAAKRRWWKKHAAETVAHRKQRNKEGLHETNRPDKPWLRWLDQHGELHVEKELSAEELIRRYEEQEKGTKT